MPDFENRTDLTALKSSAASVYSAFYSVIAGQPALAGLMLTALLSEGHILIEGVPGIGKTLSARLLAKLLDAQFTRIQFTPDLMPSDILGTSYYDMQKSVFEFRKGPLFSDIVLIDEINRSPAKTQSALFEAMEERQITNDGITYSLGDYFLVLATQNPIEQEGTYKLPEAQLDRFFFRIVLGYPDSSEELKILQRHQHQRDFTALRDIRHILTKDKIDDLRNIVAGVFVEDRLLGYITSIVQATRTHPSIFLGASPRASVVLLKASKAYAALQGRDFVVPEDIRYIAVPALNHRISLNPEAEMEGLTAMEVCKKIIQQTEVPK
ncbi:MAG: MoxR family ATPase [Cyclobacteriaceae bacterium]|nr:MoxR family ATPase [Cyclobacteriaceae bacterium]